ncbi:MAG: class I SAM-dependent methyltransferase [Promethearchaeota archaeon]
MPVEYVIAVEKLKNILPFVISVAIIGEGTDLVYSTDNWDINDDISSLFTIWESRKHQTFKICGIEYLIRVSTSDRLIASSLMGEGHILSVKDDKNLIITRIESDGIIPFTTVEIARTLASLKENKPYLSKDIELETKKKLKKKPATINWGLKQINLPINQIQKKNNQSFLDLPFTARLMAYYRAQESNTSDPLIFDPLAERLAGDLREYLNDHIRYSEMDYPIVRSFYIENNLLTSWCNTHKKSQIVLLGAGLDTRAYRFKPLLINNHTVYEIDFPNLIHYKEEILQNEKPLCNLNRISSDLSDSRWISSLMDTNFSKNIPTFWILEGFAYYIEQNVFISLVSKLAKMSSEESEIFIDIMQSSRWYSFPYSSNGILGGPFSRHIKWGLDIKSVPLFFLKTGWRVSCSFADNYDQGRNVGQKAMIFINGRKAIAK